MTNGYRNIHALPNGSRLHWYEIDGILGQGGFGITYLAHDVNLNQQVAIKEYLPVDVAGRVETNEIRPVAGGEHADTYLWGLKRFIKEGQTLARFKHPNIVAVNAVFEENNTAYMVMEYVEGEVFEDALRENRVQSEDHLLSIMFAIMAGVEEIHAAGFIHRDIKPDNIYLRSDGTPVLLDFGSARQAFGARSETLTALVSPGFAPYEQYDTSATDKQGAWTDVYALGATFYRAVTGRGPKDAMSRVHGILEGKERFKKSSRLAAGKYSPKFLSAIDAALEFKPADRPQTIQALRELLPVPSDFVQPEPEDDSGMDLFLIPDEDDEEEETVVLSTPLISPSSTDEDEEEEETVVLSTPLIAPSPTDEDEEEEETVVLSTPLIAPSSTDEDEEEEETVVLGAPLVDAPGDKDDEVIVSSIGTEGIHDGLQPEDAQVVDSAEDAAEKHSPAVPPSQLGDDDATVILGAPVETTGKQAGADDETVILAAPIPMNDEAPAGDAASIGDSEEQRLPFATIRADLAKQSGDEPPDVSAQKKDQTRPRRKPLRGLLTRIGIAAGVVIAIVSMWVLLNPHSNQGGFTGLSKEERVALQARREEKERQELTAQQAAEEKARIQEQEAARLAEPETSGVAEAETSGVAEAETSGVAEAETPGVAEAETQRLAEAEAQRLAEAETQRLAEAEAQRLAEAEAQRLAEAETQRLAEAEAQRLAEAEAQRLAEVETQRLAEAETQRLAEAETQRLAEAETQRLAETEAQRLAEAEAQRLAEAEAQRLAEAEAQRLAEAEAQAIAAQEAQQLEEEQAQQQAADHQRKIDVLVSGFESDLAALRLTSPAGNNALSKLQTLLVLDPEHPVVNTGFDAIVGEYIGLSQRSSSAGQFDKAENYLDKAATVFADSSALEGARENLSLLRVEADEKAAADEGLATAKAEDAARIALQQAEVEQIAKIEAEKLVTIPEVTKSGPCTPRLLEPRPSAFPDVVSSVYSHPAFLNAPAPKIKWAEYHSSSIINKKASEESTSRYEILDVDGVSARVQKSHELSFDNGAGTARFDERLIGEHVQILGGLISPVDVIEADRETSITDKGITNTTTTKKSTRTTLTRVYDISGQLFPLKVGNSFSYRSDARVVGKDGEVRSVTHKGQPFFYRVSKVVPGSTINNKLECDVYVVDYVFAKPNYHNAGQLFYSEEIGLIARQVGDSVSTLQDGRSISRHYERTLLDFQP